MNERATLLLELGTEEIPARMLPGAAADLARIVAEVLDRSGIAHGEVEALWTPRRLAVRVRETAPASPVREETLTGPPARAAWDADGRPTRAAEGFARKHGVEAAALERVETPRGEYAALRVRRGGEPVGEILGRELPGPVARMSFPKTMRWGDGQFRFVRPVHWIVALHGEEVLPVELFGVRAGRRTRGHRTLGPGPHEVSSADSWEDLLRAAGVVVDPARRRERLVAALGEAAAGAGGRIVDDPELLEEVADMVEYPGALVGSFDERFPRELPPEVLRTCLRHHQKAFLVAGEDGPLPAFGVAVNVPGDPEGHVRRGHEWVVSGRLEDALFFWREDRRRPLADRFEELGGVVFHRDLGTYAEKARRVARLADLVGGGLGLAAEERDALDRAARLCRCDLVTGLVGEFPELQGVAGGLLARADGEPEAVATAIYHLYEPAGAEGELPPTRVARLLGLADRLDTLAGGFAVGLVPSGSRDPFALRRAGLALVRLAESEPDLDLGPALREAIAGYAGGELGPDLRDRAGETVPRLAEFLLDRFGSIAERRGARYDEIAAVTALAGARSLRFHDLFRRLEALAEIRGSEDFLALAAAAKRVRNILAQARERGETIDPALAGTAPETPAPERELLAAVEELERVARAGDAGPGYAERLRAIARLRPVVDRFFDEILVFDPDETARRARLGLLARFAARAHEVADLAEIVVEGDREEASPR